MTPTEAEDLARRTLVVIDAQERSDDHYSLGSLPHGEPLYAADRERVESDLEGLRQHAPVGAYNPVRGEYETCDYCRDDYEVTDWPCPDASRYDEGLRRTSKLYGVIE